MHKVDVILRKADIISLISLFHQMYFPVNLSTWVKIIFTLDYISSCLILFSLIALFETTTNGCTVYTDNKVYATTDSGSEYLLVTYVINYLTNWSNHFVSKTTTPVLGRSQESQGHWNTSSNKSCFIILVAVQWGNVAAVLGTMGRSAGLETSFCWLYSALFVCMFCFCFRLFLLFFIWEQLF